MEETRIEAPAMAGARAPPMPPVPPPKDHLQPQQQASSSSSVSRYRSLRGKSMSSPRRGNKTAFNIYRDQQIGQDDEDVGYDDSDASPTRGRSLSTSMRGNAAKRSAEKRRHYGYAQTQTPPLPTLNFKSPLNPKNVNLSSPNPSRALNLQASKSAGFVRPATPEPRPLQEEAIAGVQTNKPTDREEASRWAEEVARLEAETDRILAEQKKRDLARLQAQLAAAPSPRPKPKRLILEKLTLFRSPRPNAPGHPTTPKSAPAKILAFNWSPATATASRTPSPESMSMIEPGGKGIVPQTDAPTSASNFGERRVAVRCLSSTINLPVTNDTNPIDIVYSTANLVTHKVVPADCIIIECYEVLGLERRMRNYERIRDVMNSWDRDQQNTLLVSTIDTDNHDLELSSVPRTDEAPTGFTFHIYHSSRPGKWNKRYVTLMDSGQMFAAKRPDSKSTDKDSTMLCHLSDFDIYTPRENQMRRHLKPPKKYCYAVKSQQKTNLFPNGENFVHFFSAEDDQLAHRFYELVHGWRSWYLANKKVDILPKEESSSSLRRAGTTRVKKSTSVSRHSPRHQSPQVEKAPYLIGEMQPLIDMKQFDKPLEEFGKNLTVKKEPAPTQTQEAPKQKVLNKVRPAPPAIPKPAQGESEFVAGSLLGAAYDKRKAAETVTESKKTEGPFVAGGLLNSLPTSPTSPLERPEPRSWFPSAAEHSTRSRSQSRPTQPRPRTADTSRGKPHSPAYTHLDVPRRSPSQRQGVGRGIKPPAGGPLIDFAAGGVSQSQQQLTLSRSSSKASSAGVSHSGRPRSRSTATARSGGPRHVQADQPPVPPLPFRNARRPERVQAEPMRGREQRPREPLINRVK